MKRPKKFIFGCIDVEEVLEWIDCIESIYIENYDYQNEITQMKQELNQIKNMLTKVNINSELIASNGKKESKDVFIAAFKHLQKLSNEDIIDIDRN